MCVRKEEEVMVGNQTSGGGGGALFRLMVTENKDKDFDEIKFVLSFKGMFEGSSSSSSSGDVLTFPSSLEELVERTRSILQTLDELQVFFCLFCFVCLFVCLLFVVWMGKRCEQRFVSNDPLLFF